MKVLILTLLIASFSAHAWADDSNALQWLKKQLSPQACLMSADSKRACRAAIAHLKGHSLDPLTTEEAMEALDVYYAYFLKDSHARVISAVPYLNVNAPVDPRIGIGLTGITHEKSGLRVRIVGPETPAEKAGFRAGDLITAIDGYTARKGDLADRMGGLMGSTSRFRVMRNQQPFTLAVTRSEYSVPWVQFKKTGDEGVIRILTFVLPSICSETKNALNELISQGVKSITLDLRENGGGEVAYARCVAGLFLRTDQVLYREANLKGEITAEWNAESPEPVLSEMKDPNTWSFNANGSFQHHEEEEVPALRVASSFYPTVLPMKVLVNARTASAAELLASALQDHQRATLVGERTFGKGCGQITEDLDGSGLKLFRTRYYFLRPNGGSVQRVGITPDVQTESSAGEVLREADVYPMSLPAYSNTSVR